MMGAVTITEFLLARIAEDEEAARGAIDPERPGTHWHWIEGDTDRPAHPSDEYEGREYLSGRSVDLRTIEEFPTRSVGSLPSFPVAYAEEVRSGPAAHIARHDPARVLAECEAKRLAVNAAWYDHERIEGEWGSCQSVEQMDVKGDVPDVVTHLASVYADHPDFDPKWQVAD